MSTEKLQIESSSKEEYNNIPVHYCTKCLSLNILVYDEDTSYCNDCGNTDIVEAHINEVLELQTKKIK
jgi:hypothetical protein